MKIVFYCQHVLGIGHFFRTREICEKLNDHDVFLVSGGERPGIPMPGHVREVRLDEMIRSRFSVRKHRSIWPCVSSKNRPHDVVESNICLKMWDKGRKGDVDMTVNQERNLVGRAENLGNLGRAIPQTHLPLKKSAGVGFWILRVDI